MKTLLVLCMVLAVGVGCATTPTTGKLEFNGGTYEGEISGGKANGKGTWTSDGEKYVGGWKDGRYNGQGTLTKPDGTTQSGLWRGGKYLGPRTFYVIP